MPYLPSVAIAIIAFGIIMYVILDGFDLGIGIIAPFFPSHEREIMVSTILPIWDGNETWLVLGGALLYGSFPLAFSLILPSLYLPILLMVCALLFRGVSFEFRLKAGTSKKLWDILFSLGSIVATLMQGLMLGAFIQGFHPGIFDEKQLMMLGYFWFSPFSITCAIALLFGYALLGSTWLISKTQDQIQKESYKIAKICLFIVGIFALGISAWTPFVEPHIKARWFNRELMPYLAILPMVSIILGGWDLISIYKKKERSPFWTTIGIFVCCYAGFIISAWPYLVPYKIPYWDAAAPTQSLIFILIGCAIMLPVLLYYTYHSYRIFKGKVTDVIHY